MVVLAGLRFVRTGWAIDSADASADRDHVDLVLTVLMVALGIAVLRYLVQTLLAGI